MSVPSRVIKTSTEAQDDGLQQFCYEEPTIAVLKNLAQAVGIDLSVFSSQKMTSRQMNVAVTHLFDQSNSNNNTVPNISEGKWESNWGFTSSISRFKKTIGNVFRKQALPDRQQTPQAGSRGDEASLAQSGNDADNSVNSDSCTGRGRSSSRGRGRGGSSKGKSSERSRSGGRSSKSAGSSKDSGQGKKPVCLYALIEDLGVEENHPWEPQLEELKKLPEFMRENCRETNMLLYPYCRLDGMKGPQLEIMFRDSKLGIQRADNKLCAVHINMGPGDCQWMAVPSDDPQFKSWGDKELFKVDAMWMRKDDLEEAKVKFYWFTQKPGDVVWIGPGTYYCLKALEDLNTVMWYQAPMTSWMLESATAFKGEKFSQSLWGDTYDTMDGTQCPPVKMLDLAWGIVMYRDAQNMIPRLKDNKFAEDLVRKCTENLKNIQREINQNLPPGILRKHVKFYVSIHCGYCWGEAFNVAFAEKEAINWNSDPKKPRKTHLMFCRHDCYKERKDKLKEPIALISYWMVKELKEKLIDFLTAQGLPLSAELEDIEEEQPPFDLEKNDEEQPPVELENNDEEQPPVELEEI